MDDGPVLVLDDDEDLLVSLAELIEFLARRRVYKVRSVAELSQLGAEALRCRLAILDINLGLDAPNGLDAWKWLQEHRFDGRAVFLTGHAPDHPLVADARRIDGVEVLSKPISSERIFALLAG